MKRETEYINKSHLGLLGIKNVICKMRKYTGWTLQQIRRHRRNSRELLRQQKKLLKMKPRKKKGGEKNKHSPSELWHKPTSAVPSGEGEKYLRQVMTKIFPYF